MCALCYLYRTEYWKSNARKFCDFCKCWLADNKISISYHENGKRHKENVEKHISQLTKKSAKEYKQQTKLDDEMQKMEKAALAAYLKDVENNADLTSQTINKMLDSEVSDTASSQPTGSSATEKCRPAPPQLSWLQLTSDDGNIYYWNQDTNETTWEQPEKYISIAQQKLKEKEELKKSNDRLKMYTSAKEQTEKPKELKALIKKEKKKDKVINKECASLGQDTFVSAAACGPAPRPTPYGTWAPIPLRSEEESIDLELPRTEKLYLAPPVVVEPEAIRFKERKVDSLGDGDVDFKKRKINSNAKRNIRRKIDDD